MQTTKTMKRHLKNKKGFTLIEMLIVILIIVILLAIAVPAVAGYRRDALRTQDEGAVETIRTAIEASLVRVRPKDTDTGSIDTHTSGNLDYETLIALSTDATLEPDADTREFYGALAERLGPNFKGNFKFNYEFAAYGGTYSPFLDWVSYWRSDNTTSDDSVLLYHYAYLNWTNNAQAIAAREMVYLDELIAIPTVDAAAQTRALSEIRP